MKYHAPYGISDSNASYINGNPAIGQLGSIPPAESIEYPQREIVNYISLCGISPADTDLEQLARSAQSGALNWAIDIGSQNHMQCVLNPPVSINFYPTGLVVRLKVLFNNINDATHTTLTLDAGGGARNVIMPDGSMPATNTLVSGGVYPFTYDGTRFQIGSAPGPGTGSSTTFNVNIPYCDDSGVASNAIRAIYSPAITSIAEGLFIAVKLAFPLITGACNITVNALPAKPIARPDGSTVINGDAMANQILLLCFDGVRFQIIGVLGVTARPFVIASVPSPIGQWVPGVITTQIVSFTNIIQSTLQTSTFNGKTLKIGAGEDGLWGFEIQVDYDNQDPPEATYVRAQVTRPGLPLPMFANGFTPASYYPASDTFAIGTGFYELQVGDIVSFWTAVWPNSGPFPLTQSGPPSGYPAQPNLYAYRINRP